MIWYTTCRFCQQGRLYLFKNLTTQQLYLHCEECERGFENPERLEVADSFLTLTREYEATAATWDDIRAAGWEGYAIHQGDVDCV